MELKETVVEQQVKISKFERQGSSSLNSVCGSVYVPSRSGSERWTDGGLSPIEPTPPALAPKIAPGPTPYPLMTPKDVMEESPTAPKPWPAPSLAPAHQSQVPTPDPAPAKIEPGKPLSPWDRKRRKNGPVLSSVPTVPAPTPARSQETPGGWGSYLSNGGAIPVPPRSPSPEPIPTPNLG